MKILVTGGAGFIGSKVAHRLLKAGNEVHVLDNLSFGKAEDVPVGATLHTMDIRDQEVADLFEKEAFDVLVHLAAQLDVRCSVATPGYDADINILGFLNLMEAGRKNGLKKVIFSSTGGAIYGEPQYIPQDESHPLNPISPYGITKLASENYLYYYEHTYGITSVVLRYANVYGPGQRSDGEGGVVAIFTRKMLEGESPTIYGDGNQSRDYVFVGDVAEANALALDVKTSGTYNIGTGIETSVNELFSLLKQEISDDITAHYSPGRPGEQKRSVLSYESIKSGLGWAPQVSLQDGLQQTIKWFKSRISDTV